jgi:peptidoglycan hydrolase CwlO-like protein
MKKLISLLITGLLILSCSKIHAQSINPVKGTVDHNESNRPCIVVTLDPEIKTLKKSWVRFLRKEYDVKLKGIGLFRNSDLLHADQVVIEQLSFKQLDFYTQIIEGKTSSEMKVFASLGYDIYISEEVYPKEFIKINKMLTSFIKQFLPEYYSEQITISKNRVKTLKKEISSLKKRVKSNKKDIENHEEKVEELNISIKDNSEKLKSSEEELKNRENKLNNTKRKLQAL